MSTRQEILEMLATGQIDVDEAERLLNATGDEPAGELPPQAESPAPAPRPQPRNGGRRWLHIEVSSLETGRSRVRVNVPLGLVRFGMRVGARFTDELDADLLDDVLAAVDDPSISGTLVEVEDLEDDERVHIYID